jgi:Ni,Fe-hydrogenase III large subunit
MGSTLRTIAVEIERIACHVGDMGGICADIGFVGGSAMFARLRGRVLGMAERLSGSRFLTAYIVPGGVPRPLRDGVRRQLISEAAAVARTFAQIKPVLLDNYGALERMEGIGRLPPSRAHDLGILGPAGRASGVRYDVRERLHLQPYRDCGWSPVYLDEGDVYARVRVRAMEVDESLALVQRLLADNLDTGASAAPSQMPLPANRVGVGIVESWRGELVHLIFTGPTGEITRYSIKDPSVNNWSGLANAMRGEQVSDFPVCNKSFSLSYSGNDL